MGAADADARKLAKVIDHPIRARIIDLLGERGALGWKELSTELDVRTGALYHHLDTLEGLVERDPSKKYTLTKSGRIVYARTSQSHTIDAVKKAVLEIKQQGEARRLAFEIFIPRSSIRSLTSTKPAAMVLFSFAGAFVLISNSRASLPRCIICVLTRVLSLRWVGFLSASRALWLLAMGPRNWCSTRA